MQVPPFSLTKQLAELGTDLDSALLRVLQSGQFIGGDEVKAFEDAFADNIGVDHVVGCNSGTDALVLALRSLDIGIGDEVITSGGIIGTINKVTETRELFLQISENVEIKIAAGMVADLYKLDENLDKDEAKINLCSSYKNNKILHPQKK